MAIPELKLGKRAAAGHAKANAAAHQWATKAVELRAAGKVAEAKAAEKRAMLFLRRALEIEKRYPPMTRERQMVFPAGSRIELLLTVEAPSPMNLAEFGYLVQVPGYLTGSSAAATRPSNSKLEKSLRGLRWCVNRDDIVVPCGAPNQLSYIEEPYIRALA